MIKMQSACSTYILDMGDPIKVLDLAEKMISLSGLRPYVDVAIEFIGLRPGEKIHEVLYNEHSALDETCHKSIFYVQDNAIDKKLTTDEKFALELHTKSPTDLSDALDMLYIAVKQKDEQKALQYVDKILGIAKAL